MVLVDLLIEVQPQRILRVSQRRIRPRLLTLRHGTLLEIPLQLILPRIILAGTLLGQLTVRLQPHTTQVSQRHIRLRLLTQLYLQRHNQLEHHGLHRGLLHIIQVC
jgi:hypothetical protein